MTKIRALCLLFAPVALLAGCSQAPSGDQADLQERLTAAEARATAAEKRAKNAEALVQQHAQEPVHQIPQGAPPEIADGGGTEFGAPMNDTRPIEPVPLVNPGASQQ